VPATGEVVLEVHGARRLFARGRGLDGAALCLRGGEIYALLGPNGAGKTSLVRAICGRLRLDAGEVRLLGGDPRRDRSLRRQLGLVPQEIALYPDLTVRENLALFARLAGLPRREVRAAVAEGLDWATLADRADSPVGTLSGGQRRRANLAAGALHRPQVLLLDEPTVGVDPAARERLHAMLRELRARGTAILLATHDLDQATELADRVGILVDGRVAAEGTLAQLVAGAFGGRRELRVRLAREPDEAAAAALGAEGLRAGREAHEWSGPVEGDLAGLPELGRRLGAAGVPVAEVRLREPGLRGVFFHVAGRELDE
jgi:ABC-2 type transport system ATP-binding protein